MTSSVTRMLPFLTSLNGISCFDDLNEKISSLKSTEPAKLNVIFVSLYEDFRKCFTSYAGLYFARKKVTHLIHVRELHLYKFKKDVEAALEGTRKTFVFDSVSNIETLALIIRAMEKGHEIYVFHPWVHIGKERRSAFSTLIRSCKSNSLSISQSEMEMWSSYAMQRVRSLSIFQSCEFI